MTRRAAAMGCLVWDRYPVLALAVLVGWYGCLRHPVWATLGLVLAAMAARSAIARRADRRGAAEQPQRLVVILDRDELEGFAAEQGYDVDELLERSVALNQHLWRHGEEPLGVVIIDLLEWNPSPLPAGEGSRAALV